MWDSFQNDVEDESDPDEEMKRFLLFEKAKAKFQLQTHDFQNLCWDKCVEKRSDSGKRMETCLANCVDRFIDTSLIITNHFQNNYRIRFD